MTEVSDEKPVKKRRAPAKRKKPDGRKTAVLFAISLVLGIVNLMLLAHLGVALR